MGKRVCLLGLTLLLSLYIHKPVHAAELLVGEVSIEIQSPKQIQAAPIYEGDIAMVVKNQTNQELKDLDCYLTIVDAGRKQTYPVDEFGENAYQTRKIEKLAPGDEAIIKIPVKVQYVGNFRFTGSVIDYSNNKVFTGTALTVHMDAVSNLNRVLVLAVSVVVPIGVLGIMLLLRLRKSRRK